MRLSLVTEPTDPPLTLDEVRTHLRLDEHEDDAYALALAEAAREIFEQETGRQLVTATWRLHLDAFPASARRPIEVPRPPLQSVTSITYIDAAGTQQTWDPAEYQVDALQGPRARKGLVYPKAGFVYPLTARIPNAVTVTFVAGAANGSLIPEGARAALLLILADLYENREAQVTGTIVSQNATLQRLLHRYRVQVYA